jgi:hypothetical protein
MITNSQYPVKRLSQDEFTSALRKGLGRALLHVIHYGLDDVIEVVLEACIHNQTYDAQCEPSRAAWLFSMFGDSPYYPRFRKAILLALETATETWNLLQLCQLAKELAAHGDEQARRKLRERVHEKANNSSGDDWLGADEWVELEGVDGVLELARLYGQRLLRDPDDFPYEYLIPPGETERDFKEVLFQHSLKEPVIKVYWDYLERQEVLKRSRAPVDKETVKLQTRERVRQEYPLERILNDARSGVGSFAGHYAGFGRYATTEELEEVYAHLLNETEETVRVRLLWVFRRAPMPRLSQTFFDWAVGPSEPLRAASIAALAQLSDEQIHDLARLKTKTGQLSGADSETLDLFLRNYDSGDASLITQTLASIEPNTEEAHELGFSIIQLAEGQNDPGLANALKWAYENTPCTNCRYWAVVQLDGFQQLDELLYECQFDAEDDIRAFAQKGRSTNYVPNPDRRAGLPAPRKRY